MLKQSIQFILSTIMSNQWNVGGNQSPATMLPPMVVDQPIQFLHDEFSRFKEDVQIASGNGFQKPQQALWTMICGTN